MSVSITLNWADNPAGDNVTGYRVSESANGAAYVFRANTVKPTLTITDPPPAIYSYVIQAMNANGIGPMSPPVAGPKDVKGWVPVAPATPTITVTVV